MRTLTSRWLWGVCVTCTVIGLVALTGLLRPVEGAWFALLGVAEAAFATGVAAGAIAQFGDGSRNLRVVIRGWRTIGYFGIVGVALGVAAGDTPSIVWGIVPLLVAGLLFYGSGRVGRPVRERRLSR